MDAKTLKALKGSIAKWRDVAFCNGEDNGADNCPLCELFLDRHITNESRCSGCPVEAKTGLDLCRDTPYVEFDCISTNGFAETKEAKAAAIQELRFPGIALTQERQGMKTTMKAFRDWINSLPDGELSIEAVAHSMPLTAKRVIAYREKGGVCIITNPMGTHLSDEFFSEADIISIFQP